jgi:hypothetical protein
MISRTVLRKITRSLTLKLSRQPLHSIQRLASHSLELYYPIQATRARSVTMAALFGLSRCFYLRQWLGVLSCSRPAYHGLLVLPSLSRKYFPHHRTTSPSMRSALAIFPPLWRLSLVCWWPVPCSMALQRKCQKRTRESLVSQSIVAVNQRYEMASNDIVEPEFRLPVMATYLCLTAVGFFAWGQAAYTQQPWPIPVVLCLGMINLGIQLSVTGIVTYIVDCHCERASEAFAAMNFVKNMFAFGLVFYLNDWLAKDGVRDVFFVIGGVTAGCSLLTIPM